MHLICGALWENMGLQDNIVSCTEIIVAMTSPAFSCVCVCVSGVGRWGGGAWHGDEILKAQSYDSQHSSQKNIKNKKTKPTNQIFRKRTKTSKRTPHTHSLPPPLTKGGAALPLRWAEQVVSVLHQKILLCITSLSSTSCALCYDNGCQGDGTHRQP